MIIIPRIFFYISRELPTVDLSCYFYGTFDLDKS